MCAAVNPEIAGDLPTQARSLAETGRSAEALAEGYSGTSQTLVAKTGKVQDKTPDPLPRQGVVHPMITPSLLP